MNEKNVEMDGNLDIDFEMVCQKLRPQQIAEIIRDLEGKSCSNCRNDNCQSSMDNSFEFTNCVGWFNPVLIGRSKVLKK
ncbi:MAG: hypothetical protein HFI87_04590 [Bacilli bacterium]|nr:hypothetical protein [Bacilli bacterium]